MQRPPSETLYVDLGLPSGNRWAVANLDVTGPYYFQQSPFQYECSFFSWGNLTPHNPISESEFDYDFGGVNSASPWYEGQPYGSTPGAQLTADIPLTMDAARSLLGGPWRMPAGSEFKELTDNCIYIDADGDEVDTTKVDKRVTVNGVLGLYLQSKVNGNRLFFACSGNGRGTSWNYHGTYGSYWSATFYSMRDAYRLYFHSGGVVPLRVLNSYKYVGQSLRPIWNPRDLRG